MFWGLFALIVIIWFMAVVFIARGLQEPKLKKVVKPEPKKEPPEELEIAIEEPTKEEPAEIIPISIPIETAPIKVEPIQDDFYQRFGKANIVEFPAEYIDGDNVSGLSGNKISIVEFAKNCYREIGFQCLDLVMARQESGKPYKVNIFDLASDHYESSDDAFIDLFGSLKEEYAQEIESININPDITPLNKKALAGRYDSMPQLVVWNKSELFLVTVRLKEAGLSKREMDFLEELVIEKKLFKAKIFIVTQKEKPSQSLPTTEPIHLVRRPAASLPEEKESPPPKIITRKPFTKKEIKFLKDNAGRLTNEELAKELGRSIDSVTHKLSRMGSSRQSYDWTKDKDNFLKENIKKLSYRQLAQKLGTTIPSVRARCKKINIKK